MPNTRHETEKHIFNADVTAKGDVVATNGLVLGGILKTTWDESDTLGGKIPPRSIYGNTALANKLPEPIIAQFDYATNRLRPDLSTEYVRGVRLTNWSTSTPSTVVSYYSAKGVNVLGVQLLEGASISTYTTTEDFLSAITSKLETLKTFYWLSKSAGIWLEVCIDATSTLLNDTNSIITTDTLKQVLLSIIQIVGNDIIIQPAEGLTSSLKTAYATTNPNIDWDAIYTYIYGVEADSISFTQVLKTYDATLTNETAYLESVLTAVDAATISALPAQKNSYLVFSPGIATTITDAYISDTTIKGLLDTRSYSIKQQSYNNSTPFGTDTTVHPIFASTTISTVGSTSNKVLAATLEDSVHWRSKIGTEFFDASVLNDLSNTILGGELSANYYPDKVSFANSVSVSGNHWLADSSAGWVKADTAKNGITLASYYNSTLSETDYAGLQTIVPAQDTSTLPIECNKLYYNDSATFVNFSMLEIPKSPIDTQTGYPVYSRTDFNLIVRAKSGDVTTTHTALSGNSTVENYDTNGWLWNWRDNRKPSALGTATTGMGSPKPIWVIPPTGFADDQWICLDSHSVFVDRGLSAEIRQFRKFHVCGIIPAGHTWALQRVSLVARGAGTITSTTFSLGVNSDSVPNLSSQPAQGFLEYRGIPRSWDELQKLHVPGLVNTRLGGNGSGGTSAFALSLAASSDLGYFTSPGYYNTTYLKYASELTSSTTGRCISTAAAGALIFNVSQVTLGSIT